LRENTVDCLEIEGAEVFGAAGGNSGFERFVEVRPHVIVCDLWMPDGTGYDLIARVRAFGGLTLAIAVSAAENMPDALLAGFHAFLQKPFDLFQLVDVIAEFAKTEGGQAVAPWTISIPVPGRVASRTCGG